MAYNRRYNPDALPAHMEPEQAAQMIGRTSSSSRDSKQPTRSDSYSNRPPPPQPSQSRQDDRYGSGYDRKPARTGSYSDDPRVRQGSYGSDQSRHGSDQGKRYESGPPPPPQQQQQSGSSGGYGGRAPPPPPSRGGIDEDELWRMFKAVDRDRSGHLSEDELGAALVNGDYTRFDTHTVKMMIRMFDVDRSGTISFDEFCLWAFLGDWRKLFDRFDVDQSGTISFEEFSDALIAFGYRLSQDYVKILFNSYDFRGRGVLSFDLFVQSCISLKRMTEVFKKYDTDRDGYITLSFEEFLAGAQTLFLFDSISPETDRGVY